MSEACEMPIQNATPDEIRDILKAAKTIAAARPIPDVAPVMSATLPSSRRGVRMSWRPCPIQLSDSRAAHKGRTQLSVKSV